MDARFRSFVLLFRGRAAIAYRSSGNRTENSRQITNFFGAVALTGGKVPLLRCTAAIALALLLATGGAVAQVHLNVGKSGGPLLLSLVELGQEAKIWQADGLDVQSIEFAGEAKTMQALAAGAIDLGFGSGIGLAFPLKGVPATAVAAVSDSPNMLALIVLPNSSIMSVDDLKGKTIGVSTVGSLTEFSVKELSRVRGWGVDGLRPLAIGTPTDGFAALFTGQIDGEVLGVGAAYESQNLGRARLLLTFGSYIKTFHANVLYASNKLIADNPRAIELFLKGWFETLAYARAHPDVAAKVAAQTEHISEKAARDAYEAEVFIPASKDGAFVPAAIEVVRRALKETGVLADVPPASELYSTRFVPVGQ